MGKNHSSKKEDNNPHRAKFTQGMLDNERILEALAIIPGQIILDAGCGNGYMSKLFAIETTLSGKVYALDMDTHFIETLKNDTQHINIEAIKEDITKPTCLKESTIDLIYISAVLHAFSRKQIQGFIIEVQRLLKPDGKLAIVEIEKKETPFGPPLKQRFSPEELKKKIPMIPVKTVPAGEHFYMQIFRNSEK